MLGYLGLLAAIVILAILFIKTMQAMGTGSVQSGQQKALEQLNEPGEEKLDPGSEIQDTVRDAMGR